MICNDCLGYFKSDDDYQQHKCPLESHEVINSLHERLHELQHGDIKACGCCGGTLVKIRGRFIGTEQREVCPTCLAERMDQIRQIAEPSYGIAYAAVAEGAEVKEG